MHDAAAVSRRNPFGDLQGVADGAARRQRTSLEPRPERLAVNQLGGDEGGAAIAAEVEDREDVRVRELRHAHRFPFEPRAGIRIVRELPGENLDGDLTVQPRIEGSIHLSHSAFAERRHDFVRAKPRADR